MVLELTLQPSIRNSFDEGALRKEEKYQDWDHGDDRSGHLQVKLRAGVIQKSQQAVRNRSPIRRVRDQDRQANEFQAPIKLKSISVISGALDRGAIICSK